MSRLVTLTEIEAEIAAEVGVKRRIKSRFDARKDKLVADKRYAWTMDIEGAAAEMAYAKYRNQHWTASINSFLGPDHGQNVQIKWTHYEDGHLIVPSNNNPNHYYVLVTGQIPNFQVIG